MRGTLEPACHERIKDSEGLSLAGSDPCEHGRAMSDASPLAALWAIFDAIPDLATPEQVQHSLRLILDDSCFEMLWWDWERESYVDVHFEPTEPEPGETRVLTLVEYETRKIGALMHDPKLFQLPTFSNTLVPMMRIAMERDRLHRDLIVKLDQLKASRLRLVEAAEAERLRVQRNLHDGAQQRLVVLLLELRRVDAQTRGSDAEPMVKHAIEEAEAAIDDLRHLARGLHPPMLLERGLAAALRASAGRVAMPVELELDLERRLPPAVEAAAYYVCAEAVTNAVKHAQASTITLGIEDTGKTLRVNVRDDGVGGICDTDGTGLRGLRDRVEALDGIFEVESPPGQGTRVVAMFPLESEV
jgi:signal transduction histidine kinase